MRRKILFAVMALLTMATGKIWAQGGTTTNGSTAYVVLCEDNSLHFLCSSETLAKDGTLSENGPKISEVWSGEAVTNTGMLPPNWKSKRLEVTKVVFEPSFANAEVKSCLAWFNYFTNLTAVTGLENLKTSSETSMQGMFAGCGSLTSLDLSNFDTSKVSDMTSMFSSSALTSLDLSNFDTQNVKSMGSMFERCKSLTSLNLSDRFNTLNVSDMTMMFAYCNNLTSLDLSSFDTSNVESMFSMFYECSSLTTLDLSSFATSKVTDMSYMFQDCSSLTTLNLSKFNMSSVTNNTNMFYKCTSLSLLDLSSVTEDVSKIIGKLPVKSNSVINVKTNAEVPETKKNIVVNGTCENFEINASNITTLSLPYSFKANKVTFKRSFAAGKAHTVYLPFAISSATADYKLYEYSTYDSANGIVKFSEVNTTTVPNTPYLLVPNTEVTAITVENATVSATTSETAEEEGFNGVYEKRTFTQEEADEKIYYGWANGEFRRAGAGAYVNPCRAYLKLPAENGVGETPARLSVKLGDGTTGIGTVKSDADGGTEAPVYNLQGQRVSGSYRGVVIKNGKKMIVK